MPTNMNIGQLAKRVGVSVDTIRYYEKQGVLPKPLRAGTGIGYRAYGDVDVRRLDFILRAKSLGFTLNEISELIKLTGDALGDMSFVKSAVHEHLKNIETKMKELKLIRTELEALVLSCPGHGEIQTCPIVASLSKEKERSNKKLE